MSLADHLGRQVIAGTNHASDCHGGVERLTLGRFEVGDDRCVRQTLGAQLHKHVLGLEIAVRDARLVQERQALEHAVHHPTYTDVSLLFGFFLRMRERGVRENIQ